MSVELAQPADEVHRQVGDDDHGERVLVALADAVVDRGPHEQPAARLGGGAARGDQRSARRRSPSGRAGSAPRRLSPVRRLSRHRPRPRTGRRRRPSPASRSAGRPSSTRRPSSSTTARSASASVESRCAATSTVRPSTAGRRRDDQVVLGVGVDGRQRIVEHDHPGAGDERAGERDPLALAAREVHAALADQGVVAVGQVGHEVGDAGGHAHRLDLVPGRVGPAGGQVLAQRDREQDRPLRDHGDRLAHVASATSRRSTPPTGRCRAVGS